MLRNLSYAAAAAFCASLASPAAFADQTVEIDIRVYESQIIDPASAEKALRSFERQALKVCQSEITSIKRKVTDWRCVDDVIEQVVTQLDIPVLTATHATSEQIARLSQRFKHDG